MNKLEVLALSELCNAVAYTCVLWKTVAPPDHPLTKPLEPLREGLLRVAKLLSDQVEASLTPEQRAEYAALLKGE